MKKLIKSKLLLQVIVASMVATLATAGMVGAATTVGSNINSAGTLTVTGANTLYGATSIGGALTATSTLAVTGTSAFTGAISLAGNASTTGSAVLKSATINSDTGAISFGDENLSTTGTLASGALTVTGALSVSGNASTTGSGVLKSATINSDTGAISFGDENLTTTGTVTATTFTGAFTGALTGTSTRATNLAAGATNQIPYQSAYNTTAFATAGTDGQILVANGSGVPTFVTLGTDAAISNAGALTISANAVQGTDISLASEAAGDIMYNNGTDWVRLASSTDGYVLTLDSNGWPSWSAVVASLGNTAAWTAAQLLDEGFSVDTTAFAVTGAGVLSTTQAAALNGGITVDTSNFTVDGTTGAITTASTLGVTGLTTATGGLTSIATTTLSGRIQGATPLLFDGATANDGVNVLTIGVTDPTGARTITFPDNSGTIALTADPTFTGTVVFDTASSTGTSLIKAANINSNTGAISFGDENLTTTGRLNVSNATTTLLSIGSSNGGTTIAGLLFGTCTPSIGLVIASTTVSATCTAAGVDTTYKVFVTPYITDPTIIFTSASSTATGIQVSVYNTGTTGNVADMADNVWSWMAIK